MNIQQLRYLTSLAENETLTAAATVLGVSQPSISRSLRELELELQTPILKRSGRRLCFTKAGNDILDAARRAVAAFNDVSRAAAGASEAPVLRIGICHSTFVQIMPALQLLTKHFPKLHVRTVQVASSDEMLGLLHDGSVDVCFGMQSKTGTGKTGRGVLFTPHEDLEVVLLSPPGTRLPDTVTFADLSHLPMVCLLPCRERTQMVDNLCQPAGQPDYVLECNDPSTFLEAVRGGIGSALGWRSIGEAAHGVEMRCFHPRRIIPIGFYHLKKPPSQVRMLLTLARPRKPALGKPGGVPDAIPVPMPSNANAIDRKARTRTG